MSKIKRFFREVNKKLVDRNPLSKVYPFNKVQNSGPPHITSMVVEESKDAGIIIRVIEELEKSHTGNRNFNETLKAGYEALHQKQPPYNEAYSDGFCAGLSYAINILKAAIPIEKRRDKCPQ